MTMDRFMASALDRWLTTPPEWPELPLPGDPGYPTCSDCGHWLKREPIPFWVDTETYFERCHGLGELADPMAREMGWDVDCDKWRENPHAPHWFISGGVQIVHRICAHCGYNNPEVVF